MAVNDEAAYDDAWIAAVPKIELHVHHLGATSAHTVADLAAAHPEAGVPADPAALHRRRQQAARDIDAVPQVQRALWSTESTLLVYLQRDQPDPKPALCRILERYDELAASRIQLQPPDGSGKAVRFIQCRAY